jgi:hypothetical protein
MKILDQIKASVTLVTDGIYAVFMAYSVFIGVLAAAMFATAFIIGGSIGEGIAVNAGNFMKTAIPASAIGAGFGLLGYYIRGKSTLTVNDSETDNAE